MMTCGTPWNVNEPFNMCPIQTGNYVMTHDN